MMERAGWVGDLESRMLGWDRSQQPWQPKLGSREGKEGVRTIRPRPNERSLEEGKGQGASRERTLRAEDRILKRKSELRTRLRE